MQYELKVSYKDSQPSEIWGPYNTKDEAQDAAIRAKSFPKVVDIILIPVAD